MATIIDRKYVSDDALRQLVLKPKQSFQQIKRKNKWQKYKKYGDDDDEEDFTDDIIFFRFTDCTNSWVKIPYYFSSLILHNRPNLHLTYPSSNFQFTETLYEIQETIAIEALNHLNTKGTAILNLYTGSGKTVVGAYLAAKTNRITLILIAQLVLIPQWKNTFKDFTNAVTWVVGEDPPPYADVIICMCTQFNKLPQEYLKNIGTLIIDEAHDFCTPSRSECLLGTTPQYVIALTATLERKNGMHSIIHAICGYDVIKKISKKPFNIFKYNTGITVPIKQNREGDPDWSDMQRKLAEDLTRNNIVLKIISDNPHFKILILTWRKEHVKYLVSRLEESRESVDYMCGNKKSYSDSRILIGTIKKIGQGFDEKTACPNFNGFRINMLILLGSMRSIGLLEQVAGRVFRSEFPQIIHFVDDMKISENHWNEGQRWYKSRNGAIHFYDTPNLIEKRKTQTVMTDPLMAQMQLIMKNQNNQS